MASFLIVLINILWFLYSLTEGVREGFYWYYENRCRRVCEFNVNRIFNSQRILVLLLFFIVLLYNFSLYAFINTTCLALIFPYFHNSAYYYTRNKLDSNVHNKNWIGNLHINRFSIYIPYKTRIIAMLLGILVQIFTQLFIL